MTRRVIRKLFRGQQKPININDFGGLSQKWVGVKLFMCFPFSWEKRERINKILRESQEKAGTVPGQSRENFVYVFSCLLFFLNFVKDKAWRDSLGSIMVDHTHRMLQGVATRRWQLYVRFHAKQRSRGRL